jgi:type IV pilus assembly protein PilM
MLSFLTRKKDANIEIKDYVIRYGDIKHHAPVVVNHYKEYYLEEGIIHNGKIIDMEAFKDILHHCVNVWGLKGRTIRFIVPDPAVVIRKLEIEATIPNDEIKGHLYFELGHHIHLPFENPTLDYALLSEGDERKEVLLVASPDEIVDSYTDQFRDAKISPIIADISPLCHYRLFHHHGLLKEQESILFVQVDLKTVTITIFENHQPIFMEHIAIPYDEGVCRIIPTENGEISNIQDLLKEEMLVAFSDIYIEIERILRFYQFSLHNGDKAITTLCLTGDHLYFADILEKMKSYYAFPIMLLPTNVTKTNNDDSVDRKFHSVLGLAVKEGV